ncbi:putative ribonuclease H-like domain-containing protein [Tanacetum coccineum]|uniref:Ribonuclease H-like domain-containing protein n=1 Tax=Tanacetum coccineum TaxID=301880 RepID=A0ABQ5G8Q1_9ASTR
MFLITRRTQKSSSSTEGSKLDRGYAGRASTIQATRSLDFGRLPNGKRAIGTKWVYRNKKDEIDEMKMSIGAFLYGKIEEEVYVCQPPGFEDPNFPDQYYYQNRKGTLMIASRLPRAWYETLSTYLLDNGFQRGKTDKTLFIRRDKGDILLVQVYVDDIIFGSTKKSLCTEFEKIMHKKFQMELIWWIIHKGWLKWNVTAARDEIEVKTGNSRVNAVGHYLVLMAKLVLAGSKG